MKRAPLVTPGRHPAPIRSLDDRRLHEVRGGDSVATRPSTTAQDDWESPNQS